MTADALVSRQTATWKAASVQSPSRDGLPLPGWGCDRARLLRPQAVACFGTWYDKLAITYRGGVVLNAIAVWLRVLGMHNREIAGPPASQPCP
jgi:hypothetical protein